MKNFFFAVRDEAMPTGEHRLEGLPEMTDSRGLLTQLLDVGYNRADDGTGSVPWMEQDISPKELQTSLKRVYDASDEICEKRSYQDDGELAAVWEYLENKSSFARLIGERIEKPMDYRQLKLLLYLDRCLERWFAAFREQEEIQEELPEQTEETAMSKEERENTLQLFTLAKGNVSLNLSRFYFELYDYEQAEAWRKKAQEVLWAGKNYGAGEEQNTNGKESTRVVDIHSPRYTNYRLIRLNLAKCYQEYARINRRSDYDLANSDYKHTCRKLVKEFEKNRADGDTLGREQTMIFWEALSDLSIIERKQCVSEHNRVLNKWSIEQDGIRGITADEICTVIFESKDHNDQEKYKPIIEQFLQKNQLRNYDAARYDLLRTLEQARTFRDQARPMAAADKAVLAQLKGQRLDHPIDQNDVLMPEDQIREDAINVDALFLYSQALRKSVELDTEVNTDAQYFGQNSFEAFIQTVARKVDANLNLHTELVKWYCLLCIERVPQFFRKTNAINVQALRNLLLGGGQPSIQIVRLLLNDHAPEGQSDPSETERLRKLIERKIEYKFLEGQIYQNQNEFEKASRIFSGLIYKGKENYAAQINYIRKDAVGLKVRYHLAQCYMAMGQTDEAGKVLTFVHDELEFSRRRRGVSTTDTEPDIRVEIALGYCDIVKGKYESGYDRYIRLFDLLQEKERKEHRGMEQAQSQPLTADRIGSEKNDKKAKTLRYCEDYVLSLFGLEERVDCPPTAFSGEDDVKRRWAETFRIPRRECERALNNLAYCCLFTAKEGSSSVRKALFEKILLLRCIPDGILKGFTKEQLNSKGIGEQYRKLLGEALSECNVKDSFVAMLLGYYWIRQAEDDKTYLLYAQQAFEKACGRRKNYGFAIQNAIQDKNEIRNHIEAVSAYVIATVTLAEAEATSREKNNTALSDFVINLPSSTQLSLKAAMALARWLKGFRPGNVFTKRQMYSAFSHLSIFDERGARAFNQLRESPEFRYFRAEVRGRLYADLLCFYDPIKYIREDCNFSLEEQQSCKVLVTHSRLHNLRNIFGEETPWAHSKFSDPAVDMARQEQPAGKPPRFRINNCNYMNDEVEGEILLDIIREVSAQEGLNTFAKTEELIDRYFPKSMAPWQSNSDVYLGCFSTREDSWDMWDNYGDHCRGFSLQPGGDFFDIKGTTCGLGRLRDYGISKYSDDDYPLYVLQYVQRNTIANLLYSEHEQCRTAEHVKKSLSGKDIRSQTERLIRAWKDYNAHLDKYLKEEDFDENPQAERVRNFMIQFAADRINEIRYLFKDADWNYENEVRIVYTDFGLNPTSRFDLKRTDYDGQKSYLKPPPTYVEVNRELQDCTVYLGSEISQPDVERYSLWLTHTNRVKSVRSIVPKWQKKT